MQLISASKQARMRNSLQTMASFRMGDDSATFDDMREDIQARCYCGKGGTRMTGTTQR